ncbi:MAG: S8 family serine peptidase [Steroidobacteraceae bacterium]
MPMACEVVNQSLGSGRQWPQYPTAQATSRLAAKGVVMVASIGNNGPGGSSPDALFAAGAPGVGANVIGVASYDNAQQSFTVTGVPYGFNTATGAPAAPVSGQLAHVEDRHDDHDERRLFVAGGGQLGRDGGTDSSRHLQLLHKGSQCPGGGRGCCGALQQRCQAR